MLYYVETNLTAIIIGAILLHQAKQTSSRNETTQIIMKMMLRLLILFSASDIAAYYFRGRNAVGIQMANILYFMLMALGSYTWFLFIYAKIGYLRNLRRDALLTGLPVFILCLSIALNPMTGFYFTVDDQPLYHRAAGLPVTWVVEWGYVFTALVLNIQAILREKRHQHRRELRGYLLYAIPLSIAAVIQMLVYGTTTNQIGFLVALLIAYINQQHYQVQRDDLTGLNNKNAFLHFRDSLVDRTKPIALTMFMMDVDNFKSINDIHGHVTGDRALRDVAEVLKDSIAVLQHKRSILYRYGGDEFIIVGSDLTPEDIALIHDTIDQNLAAINSSNHLAGEKYTLALSIGTAERLCGDIADFDLLIKDADAAMYQVKKSRKKR